MHVFTLMHADNWTAPAPTCTEDACASVVLSGADTQGSVDARDEFPRISEHSSQLGKLHTTGGGRYTGGGSYPCVSRSLVCMSCVCLKQPKHGCDIMRRVRCTAGGLARKVQQCVLHGRAKTYKYESQKEKRVKRAPPTGNKTEVASQTS